MHEWQIGEIEAGIAELDSGEVLSEKESKELHKRLSRSAVTPWRLVYSPRPR